MCPEHFKDPKVGDQDVCGCPLVRKVFKPTGEFCRAPKKSCLKHYQWEKLRRAEIDMERVRQWLKLDELVEQERSIRLAMASRYVWNLSGQILMSFLEFRIRSLLSALENHVL